MVVLPRFRRAMVLTVAALAVFLFAFSLRFFTFFLQHWQGDQSQYVSLAMKYEALGLSGLNLDRIEVRAAVFAPFPDWKFMYPVLLDEPVKGDLYKAYEQYGLLYNDMPLYHKSPLFPVTLAASHHLFASPRQPFMVLNTLPDYRLKRISYNKYFFRAQFWAVIVPMASSLLTLVIVFLFALKIFEARTALYAMFLLALHPTDIVNSYKILSDNYVTFFVAASLFLFFCAYEKKNIFLTFFSGAIAGLAILAKQSALLILISAALYLIYAHEDRWFSPRAWFSVIKNKFFFFFMAGALMISAHWFLKVYEVYGNPFFQPDPRRLIEEDLSGWFYMVSHRPQAFLLFVVNVPYFCPPFVFGHLSFLKFIRVFRPESGIALAGSSHEAGARKRRALLFFWFWILPFVLFFTFRVESREERYLLPVYPALAILSGWGLSLFWERRAVKFLSVRSGRVLVAVFLLITVAWSAPMALETVFKERFLIQQPWRLVKLFYRGGWRVPGIGV